MSPSDLVAYAAALLQPSMRRAISRCHTLVRLLAVGGDVAALDGRLLVTLLLAVPAGRIAGRLLINPA